MLKKHSIVNILQINYKASENSCKNKYTKAKIRVHWQTNPGTFSHPIIKKEKE